MAMESDNDMSGLQIEDLGEYFLQTDVHEKWKGFSLGYTDDEHQTPELQHPPQQHVAGSQGSQLSSVSTIGANSSDTFEHHFPSPPLSSLSDMFKHGNGLNGDLDFVSPSKDGSTLFQTELTPGSAMSNESILNRAVEEAMELTNFHLDQQDKTESSVMPTQTFPSTIDTTMKSAAPDVPRHEGAISSDDTDLKSSHEANILWHRCDLTVPCDPSICLTIGNSKPAFRTLEDDRCLRKKSRERLRRQEVNVKFEELVDLLGLSNRVRKSAILQEAVSMIKTLKRERDEFRSDRDRLQQEVSKLATCLQYSHLGSMAAANAVAMTQQLNQQLPHLNPATHQQQHTQQVVHTHPLNISCHPGTNCFRLSSAFSTLSSHVASQDASSGSASGHVTIAPKPLTPATPTASSFRSVPTDPERT